MTERNQARVAGGAIVFASVAVPLIGAWAAGRDLGRVFRFPPPLAMPADYPRFSWVATVLVLAPFLTLGLAWRRSATRRRREAGKAVAPPLRLAARQSFRPWGWAALFWTLAWWVLAWTRFAWFGAWQRYTFLPLWLGFIVLVNALNLHRSGTCLLTRAPRQWLALFATSAGFWWLFEWLNRFARNWHYLGVADLGANAYAVNGTLCFSTVLPAVAAVAELLAGLPRFQAVCGRGPRLPWLTAPATGLVLIIGGGLALFGTGMMPTRFYAALWAAPLALLVGDAVLARRGDLPAEVAAGDWRRTATWATAALVCGVFWETWNLHSAAKWIYTVPYVDRWHLFEMPLLGYTGYLPFGLECYFVVTRTLAVDVAFSRASST